jgi:hypothetical protein
MADFSPRHALARLFAWATSDGTWGTCGVTLESDQARSLVNDALADFGPCAAGLVERVELVGQRRLQLASAIAVPLRAAHHMSGLVRADAIPSAPDAGTRGAGSHRLCWRSSRRAKTPLVSATGDQPQTPCQSPRLPGEENVDTVSRRMCSWLGTFRKCPNTSSCHSGPG